MYRLNGPVPTSIDLQILTEVPDNLPTVERAYVAVAEGVNIAVVSCFQDVAYNVALTLFEGKDFSIYGAAPHCGEGETLTARPLSELLEGLMDKGYAVCYVKEYKLVTRDGPADQNS